MKKEYSLHSQLELPFMETNESHLIEVFQVLESKFGLKKKSKQKFIDLGAGNGTVILYSALNYGIKSIGIEINSTLIQEANNRIRELKKMNTISSRLFHKIRIIEGDLFTQNLRKYEFIYIFSLPTMHKFLDHVFRTAKKHSVIISYKYPIEILKSYLQLEYQLNQQEIITYYYKKT